MVGKQISRYLFRGFRLQSQFELDTYEQSVITQENQENMFDTLSPSSWHTYTEINNINHKCEATASRYIIYTLPNTINKLEKRVLLLLPVTDKLHARSKVVSRRKLRRRLLITSNIMLPYGRDEWISQFTIYRQPCSFSLPGQSWRAKLSFYNPHCIYNSRPMIWKNTIMKWTDLPRKFQRGYIFCWNWKG